MSTLNGTSKTKKRRRGRPTLYGTEKVRENNGLTTSQHETLLALAASLNEAGFSKDKQDFSVASFIREAVWNLLEGPYKDILSHYELEMPKRYDAQVFRPEIKITD